MSVIDLDKSDLDKIEAQNQEDKSREINVGRNYLGNNFNLEIIDKQALHRMSCSGDEEEDEVDDIEDWEYYLTRENRVYNKKNKYYRLGENLYFINDATELHPLLLKTIGL